MQQEADRLKQQARELEERRKALDAEETSRRQTWTEREAQLEAELEAARERRRTATEDSQRELAARQAEMKNQGSDLEALKDQFSKERQTLDASVREHREDLARLDRQRAAFEVRETELATRISEVDRREQQLDIDGRLLEDRAQQLDGEFAKVQQEQEQVRRGKAEMELVRTTMAQRVVEIERQESFIKVHENRLERLRDELTKQTQELATQKARQDSDAITLSARESQFNARERELNESEQSNIHLREELDRQQVNIQETASQLQSLQRQLSLADDSLKVRETQLTDDRTALENSITDHREDLARSDRFRASLDQREQQLNQHDAELKLRQQHNEDVARQLEERSVGLRDSERQLQEEHERLRQLRADLEIGTSQLAEKSASTEGVQAAVLAVRAKLERLRDELRREAENLTAQRARQETVDRELVERQQLLDARAAELESLEVARKRAQQTLVEQDSTIKTAMENLHALQARLAAEEQAHERRKEELLKQLNDQTQQAAVLRDKAAHLLGLQQRIDEDRQSLQNRESALQQADLARQELERQLQLRSEQIATKEQETRNAADELTRRVAEKEQECQAVTDELARRATELDGTRQQLEADLAAFRRDRDVRAAELEHVIAKIAQREEQMQRQTDQLKIAGQSLAAERKARAESRAKWEEEYRLAAEDLLRTRTILESFQTEVLSQAAEVQKVLPDLELRGSSALDRLAHAREQLRNHLSELHQYARQSQQDLELLRSQVLSESDRLRDQQTALNKARSEHRHSVTAFRQQLIDWQGQVSELRSSLVSADAGFHRSAALAVTNGAGGAENVETQSSVTDVRNWFRWKLRELAASAPVNYSTDGPDMSLDSGAESSILPLTQELDPGDRHLGELLQSLELVDQNTLMALFSEARRQRRSLRQVMLASGKLTVYQMALIEAGNLDGLSIGPFGVIDRMRVTAHETVVRVIDPRPSSLPGPFVLRHLAEADMQNPDRPDEFWRCFHALTAIRHPHIAATIEVLEVNGRPAVLQEWLTGIASVDWPSLAASPGVWYRLACQALLGLAAGQQAGLTHGGINNRSVVLTADGLVKLIGIGEPWWLNGANSGATAIGDLIALGQVASNWATLTPRRRLSKQPRPLPPLVKRVLDQWAAGHFDSALAVLDALDQVGGQIPAGTEIWERLMKFAGSNATDGVAWRKSA
jgi:chromosome segregation ATPase